MYLSDLQNWLHFTNPGLEEEGAVPVNLTDKFPALLKFVREQDSVPCPCPRYLTELRQDPPKEWALGFEDFVCPLTFMAYKIIAIRGPLFFVDPCRPC